MIKLEKVSKKYVIDKNINTNIYALDEIELNFEKTGLVIIVGESGSGKTTLLNMLGGIDFPTSGEIYFNNKSLSTYIPEDYNNYRNNHVSFVFQEFNLLIEYSVIDNIKIALKIQKHEKVEVNKRANNALKLVGLEEFASRKINTLSGGQQQRVAIARAIAKNSDVILCDEPTGNLDNKTSVEIFDMLKEISKNSLVIVVTHDKMIAEKYADRLINLSNGQIVEDERINEVCQKESSSIIVSKKRAKGMSIRNSVAMIYDNIKKSLISSISLVILLSLMLSLTTVFFSLSQYNQQDSMVNTLKENNQHIVQVVKYIDQPREEIVSEDGSTEIVNGPQLWYEDSKIEDVEMLNKQTSNEASFYPSYFFNKNFQDFTDEFIYTDETKFSYELRSFREAISVDDYTNFHMKLVYGDYPSANNEVLIYDYMAHCLIEYGVFEGNISSVVDKVLKDKNTGLTMKIAGILKSDYANYSYIKDGKESYQFEESYITSLQTLFCTPGFIVELENEKTYNSVFKCYFANNDNGKIIETDIKKMKNISIEGLSFIAKVDDIENERGVVVSKTRLAEILDVDENDITPEIANNFLNEYSITGIKSLYDFGNEKSYNTGLFYNIIGISDNIEEEEGVLNWYTHSQDDLYLNNSVFRQIYLSLGTDWGVNAAVLDKFIFQTHDELFYNNNPDYYFEGYTDYTSYGVLIAESDYYIQNVKDFAFDIMIVMICVGVIGLFSFAVMLIHKNKYKIGVLKSLGEKKSNIILIFGIQIALVTLLSFILSIPIGFIIMLSINSTFAATINSSLVFFSISASAEFIVLGLSLITVLLAIIIPFIKLHFQSPVSIIRNNKRR